MKTNIIASVFCAVLFMVHGCGGGDTPPAANTPPDRPLETQPPTVIAMTPANNTVMINAPSLKRYLTNIYNNNSQATQRIFHTAAGSDEAWFTVDDTLSAHDAFNYDVQGNNVQNIRYSGMGADNARFADDEVIFNYTSHTYDGLNNRTNVFQFSGSGPDAA